MTKITGTLSRFLLIATIILGFNINFVLAQPNILISYYSKTGNTKTMAEAIARGALKVENVQVILKTVEETTSDDLLNAGAIIVGSPVYNANIAPQVMEFMVSWPFEDQPMKNKLGAAFVTAGGISAGEEVAMLNILHSMMIFGMIVMGGNDWTAPFGASGIRGESPFDAENDIHEMFILKAEDLGKRVAEVLLMLEN